MKEYLWTASGGFQAYDEAWKYGPIEAKSLSPYLEKDSNKIEGVYHIDCPPEVMHLCREIEKLGGRALMVGGSVRDSLITYHLPGYNLRPKDFDLEIYGIEPDDLMKILEINFNLKENNKFGKDFEIIKIDIEGWEEPLDISIPRKDSKKGDGGHRDFEITACPWMSIREAALRRDLKINSCAYDPLTEVVYDPFNGLENISRKVIEVTDENTFREDPDRIYRIMQFASRFDFDVTPQTIDLCKRMVAEGAIDKISIDRVVIEIKKFAEKSIKPSVGMRFALETGLLEKYWPEVFALVGVPQNPDWHPEGDVWVHTLQVMDAAAEIAIREGLDDEQRSILIWAAMCHDLGKPSTTTTDEKGRIISHGHEHAGVEPTLKLFSRFAKPNEPKTGITPEIRTAVAALVKDHLRPKEIWLDVVKRGGKLKGQINKFARKLGFSGTNLYMAILLAEADQRGRNGNSSVPKKREEVDELIEWQTWLTEKASEQKVIKESPKAIFNGDRVKDLDKTRKPGVWVGAVWECVIHDQMEGLISTVEEAEVKALFYLSTLTERVTILAEGDVKKEWKLWEEIRKAEDPRLYCQAI